MANLYQRMETARSLLKKSSQCRWRTASISSELYYLIQKNLEVKFTNQNNRSFEHFGIIEKF